MGGITAFFAAVMVALLGWLFLSPTDPPSTSGRDPACNSIAAIGCAALAGVGRVLDDPDAYAAVHP
jgi:hypothetical protein